MSFKEGYYQRECVLPNIAINALFKHIMPLSIDENQRACVLPNNEI
jgi:hypothetical protein